MARASLGSHLCDAVFAQGDQVICLENLSTGRISNVAHMIGRSGFTFRETNEVYAKPGSLLMI